MAITLGEELDEAVEVEGDLFGDGGRADADDGEGQVPRRPRRERVRDGIMQRVGEARHLS